jgi:hypothetical protein
MVKNNRIFYFIFLTFLFTECKKPGCLGNSGNIISIKKSLASFDQLIVNDDINIILKQDSVEEVQIDAPENIQPNITTIISDNILTINNNTDCRWLRNPDKKINLYLSFKDLKRIDYRGSGNITNTDTLRLDALQVESNTGAGNIELTVNNRYTGSYIFKENAEIILHGKSESCYSYTNARGKINFKDFIANNMVIEYGGLADTYINVTSTLDAIIYYKGNLFLKGNPAITRSDYYSSGRIIREP